MYQYQPYEMELVPTSLKEWVLTCANIIVRLVHPLKKQIDIRANIIVMMVHVPLSKKKSSN